MTRIYSEKHINILLILMYDVEFAHINIRNGNIIKKLLTKKKVKLVLLLRYVCIYSLYVFINSLISPSAHTHE